MMIFQGGLGTLQELIRSIVHVQNHKYHPEALPQLEALVEKNRKRPTVRFYQGKDQMKLVFDEIIHEADVLLSFGSADDLFRELGEYWKYFITLRLKKKIPAHVLLPDSATTRDRQASGVKELRIVQIVPPTHEFHGVTWIWKQKIAMCSFIDGFVVIVIENRQLTEMQKAMFENLWDLTEK